MPQSINSTYHKLQQAGRAGPLEGPNLMFQDVCQSSLEHEKILYLKSVHFDYTSAPGRVVLFFCNVWERSISGHWSMPIRNQCCDIITLVKQMDHQ